MQPQLTCDNSCYGIGDNRPQLNLVGIFGKAKIFDDRWKLLLLVVCSVHRTGAMCPTNSPNEYSPERIAKYAEAESHTWTSRTPRRTSDHLNDSASEASVLSKLVY